MICRNCGVYVSGNAGTCPNCGVSYLSEQAEKNRPAVTAAGAPPRMALRPTRTVSMRQYFFWWTIALFSNAELICMILSIVFVFDNGDRNRANFFRAVLLFKLILLLAGLIAVIVLVYCGFSFTDLLNHVGPRALWELLREVF